MKHGRNVAQCARAACKARKMGHLMEEGPSDDPQYGAGRVEPA